MQKYTIIKSSICNMDCFKVINLNNCIVDIVYLNNVDIEKVYIELVKKYKVVTMK